QGAADARRRAGAALEDNASELDRRDVGAGVAVDVDDAHQVAGVAAVDDDRAEGGPGRNGYRQVLVEVVRLERRARGHAIGAGGHLDGVEVAGTLNGRGELAHVGHVDDGRDGAVFEAFEFKTDAGLLLAVLRRHKGYLALKKE